MSEFIKYCTDIIPPRASVYKLYKDVGWQRYFSDLSKLMRALEGSLNLVSAWQGDELCGLCRAVGDGETILFIQDLLVLTAQRRKGIGKTMVRTMLDRYPGIHRAALVTDDTRFLRDFYASLGFIACEGRGMVSFFREREP